ncbi:hypothetical protein Alg130_03961 [Pyrenophora tritici-repentis]|nr:hypothetical protein Alg130_03961 [Pyrenophora tritici-repentis]KAI1539340.1 hypothetical protein PtrSN001A_004620 [Pyrenophora tritici-repentis]PZC97960.1 hypothetical protein A1F95_04424 [Pyrenophora tritici-repentis]PZD41894.1 hypothetical protein A1F97_04010 [Pyrenophora tritici-repentis]
MGEIQYGSGHVLIARRPKLAKRRAARMRVLSPSLSRKPPLQVSGSSRHAHDSNRNGSGAGVGDDESRPGQTWSTVAAGEAFTL